VIARTLELSVLGVKGPAVAVHRAPDDPKKKIGPGDSPMSPRRDNPVPRLSHAIYACGALWPI